jgi:hypothetical protein
MAGSQDESLLHKLVGFFAGRKSSSERAGNGGSASAGTGAPEDGSNSASLSEIGKVGERSIKSPVGNASAVDVDAAANLSCCSKRVHIAYRGVSDDRLYLAENRSTNEVKFFRPIGLRVFCADCRKRLL